MRLPTNTPEDSPAPVSPGYILMPIKCRPFCCSSPKDILILLAVNRLPLTAILGSEVPWLPDGSQDYAWDKNASTDGT